MDEQKYQCHNLGPQGTCGWVFDAKVWGVGWDSVPASGFECPRCGGPKGGFQPLAECKCAALAGAPEADASRHVCHNIVQATGKVCGWDFDPAKWGMSWDNVPASGFACPRCGGGKAGFKPL